MHKLIVKFLLLFLSICGLLAQAPPTQNESVLSPAYLAIKDKPQGEQVKVRLRYQGAYGNYLQFYDARGKLVLLAFRRHRWDYTNERYLKELERGHQYEISFRYEATKASMPAPSTPLESVLQQKEETSKQKSIRQAATIILGQIADYRPASLDDLRY